MTERNFFLERLMERAFELQARHQGNPETYYVELSKLMMQNARNEKERREWEELLKTNKFLQRMSQDDERREVIQQVRATLKARQPFVRISVLRDGQRTTRRWLVTWTNGPTEAEIEKIVAPFTRKDLAFRYLEKASRCDDRPSFQERHRASRRIPQRRGEGPPLADRG